MDSEPTRRQTIAVVGLSGISLMAGCGGTSSNSDGGNGDPSSERAIIKGITLESAEQGGNDVLTVTLETTDGVEMLSLSTADGTELGSTSINGSRTVDLYTFDSETPSGTYQITAVDSSGSEIDQTEWEPSSNIVVEDVNVERLEEDFRQLTIEFRNNSNKTVTATNAGVTEGFPTNIDVPGGDDTVGSISSRVGNQEQLSPSKTTKVVLKVDAEVSAGAEERLLAPESIECPGENSESIREITLITEFDNEPTKELRINVKFSGEYRSYYPYGCVGVKIDSWEEI